VEEVRSRGFVVDERLWGYSTADRNFRVR
jgi:hypothetical protein